jgi:hypothetical protein
MAYLVLAIALSPVGCLVFSQERALTQALVSQ